MESNIKIVALIGRVHSMQPTFVLRSGRASRSAGRAGKLNGQLAPLGKLSLYTRKMADIIFGRLKST